MAYRYSLNSFTFCLVGTVITLYTKNGFKVKQWFFKSKDNAKSIYFALVNY